MPTPRRQALIAACLAAVLALVWLRPLDALAERSVESGLKRALIAFASARALNAALSVLKEASVSFQVGAGVTVKPGAILEPLDEVVQQFSTLMFVATASLAVQRLAIGVFAWWPVCALISALLVAWALLAARGRPAPRWLRKLAVALLIVRLAVPLLALLGEATHWAVLEGEYARRTAQLSALESPESKEAPGESLVDRFKRLLAQGADIAKQVEALRAKAQDIVENLIRLAAVFLVQTVLLPLLYVCFLVWLHGVLSAPRAGLRAGLRLD